MRIHGIEIPVVDLDRAYRFYAEVLEFPVVGRFGDGMATFFLGDVHGGMVTLVKSPGASDGGGPRLLLSAEGSLEEMRAKLQAKGVVFSGDDHNVFGPIAYFLDSEGNRLGLFDHQFLPRLQQQGRQSNAELGARLREMEARTFAAIEGLSEAQAAYRPAPAEWPILGHLAHMVDTLESCVIVAGDLAAGRQPPRDRLLEKEYALAPLDGSTARLRQAFAEADAWLAGLPAAKDGAAMLAHGVFGQLNHREWAAFMIFHVGMHTGQVKAMRDAAGFPGR
ncbi:MAG: DinB family protein [Chloroflexi bacterium]|nr:DinB family protein [Chloroflexota bacterium]